jgi:hypothetical protein
LEGDNLERSFLAARSDFVVRTRELAKKKKQTLYGLVNETLEQLLRADEMDSSLPEIVENYFFLKIARETGFTLISEKLLEYMLERVSEEENESLTNMFYKMGEWLGKYCQVRFTGEEPLRVIEKTLGRLFWDVSEFDIAKDGDGILVQCIGSRISGSYTTLLSMFLEGLMHSFEYSTIKRDVSKGIISLGFR